jgi:hypothetical protein
MGYDLHVTRADTWLDSEATPITFDEWQAYFVTDPSLRSGGEESPECVLWADHPREPFPIWWYEGEVRCKNPDEATVAKLVAIARQLGARVLGDDGEEYSIGPAGAVQHRQPPPPRDATQRKRRNSWWERLIDQLNGYRPED